MVRNFLLDTFYQCESPPELASTTPSGHVAWSRRSQTVLTSRICPGQVPDSGRESCERDVS
eukprot:1340351-Amorphochlora_amoeboformis.AAC.1